MSGRFPPAFLGTVHGQELHFMLTDSRKSTKSSVFSDFCDCAPLTSVNGGLALHRERLQTLLVGFQTQVGQVLLDLPGHLRVLIQLFGVEEGAPSHPLLVPARLADVQDGCVGTALA